MVVWLALPLMGWIVSIIAGSVAVWLAANIFNTVMFTVYHMIFFAAGIYLLVKYGIPKLYTTSGLDKYAAMITLIAIALIALGIPKLLFSFAGNNTSYSIVP